MTDNHIMIFDTETTGLPKNWRAPMQDLDNWPRVIQLAWMLVDLEGNVLNTQEILIKPNGWEIPKDPFWIEHGFATEISLRDGKPLQEAMDVFLPDLRRCAFLVSHNMEFDHKVLGAEMLRLGLRSGRTTTRICTKEASTDYCKIPFSGSRYKGRVNMRYKWPKLSELHVHLFGKEFDNAHQAGGDVAALKACLFELIARGVIRLQLQTDSSPQNPTT